MKKKLKFLLTIFSAGIILYIAASFISVDRFLCANHISINFPDTLKLSHEDVQFKTSDNLTIKGWFFPANSEKAIVLLHGWKANRLEPLPRVKFLHDAGYNVLVCDARACGESEGDLISLGYYESEDLLAAIKFLKEKRMKKIAADGISQGGATIVFAAAKTKDLDCIIIESCYDELTHAVNNRFQSMLFIPGEIGSALMIPIAEKKLNAKVSDIAPANIISKIEIPIFVISGAKDTRTTEKETKKMYDSAKYDKQLWIVHKAGHEDLYRVSGAEYEKKILEFLSDNIVTEFKGKASDNNGFLKFMSELKEDFIKTGDTTYLKTLNDIAKVSDGAVSEMVEAEVEDILKNRPKEFISYVKKLNTKESEHNLEIYIVFVLLDVKWDGEDKYNSLKNNLMASVKGNTELESYLLRLIKKAENWK
ncbi:MAG: prolyl oligopeptidase family serine peptidase [Ignavibacteria bacterium]|nr:prolyl oligopeptidase family serine peptidase [Ignavibacteria bacterium]